MGLSDANLVLATDYAIASVPYATVGTIDLQEAKILSEGVPLELRFRVTTALTADANAIGNFIVMGASDAALTSDTFQIASSAMLGNFGGISASASGSQPQVGAVLVVPLGGWVGYGVQATDSWSNMTVYGRRYLGVRWVSYNYALTGGASGNFTGGKFTVELGLQGSHGNFGRIYRGGY